MDLHNPEIAHVQAAADGACGAAVKIRMGGPKKRARESSAFDAESMGAPGRSSNAQSDPLAVLGDAGMVLRDPATMRLIIHHVSSSHMQPMSEHLNSRPYFISLAKLRHTAAVG